MQTVFGNSINTISKIFDRYSKSKESYKNDGYTIVTEDIDKLSFTAEKKYEGDDIDG